MNALEIIHRAETYVVIDKPGGLLSVPGRGPAGADSVVSRLRTMIPHCIEQPAAHRLDMDTSGLMVLGLTRAAQSHLTRQFELRRVQKFYLAVLEGCVPGDGGLMELAFRLDPENRPRQIYDSEMGKIGRTRWRKLVEDEGLTYVEFQPLTGRTHQLRVHAAHARGLGCPIVGDRLYGSGTAPGPMQLHAAALSFADPESGQRMVFRSPFPAVGHRSHFEAVDDLFSP